MPLKRVIRPLLEDESELASAVGAVNTVTFTDDGLVGDNTDVTGIIRALGEGGVTRPGSAAVLGGGATATSAVVALFQLGCSSVTVHARRYSATAPLREAAERWGGTVQVRGLDRAAVQASRQAPVVISTLPPTAADDLATMMAETFLTGTDTGRGTGSGTQASGPVLLDVVYTPWPTELARHWSAAGGTVVSGLSMLVHQAAEQVRLMTGRNAPVEVMRAAGVDELTRRATEPGE